MTAGQQNLTTAETTIFDATNDGGGATAIKVQSEQSSAGELLVHVDGLHAAGEYDHLQPGQREYYRRGLNGIAKVTAKGAAIGGGAATATVTFAITARLEGNPAAS